MSSASLESSLQRLSVNGGQLGSTRCIVDRLSQQLNIFGWSQCMTDEGVIALTVIDQTDQLEWTSIIGPGSQYGRLNADEPLKMVISSSSLDHQFVVRTKALRRFSEGSGSIEGVECYKITSENSCTATKSYTPQRISLFPVLDVRPRLRFNVGMRSGVDMVSILTARSPLPTKATQAFTCAGNSVQLQIYQGDSRQISLNKRVHGIEVRFHSTKLKKTVTVSLSVNEDGTLETIAMEEEHDWNINETVAPQIIGVICPKTAVDTKDPYRLHAEWTRTVSYSMKAVLTINTSYAEIQRWRVSVAEGGAATGNAGYVFLFPRDGFSQRFEIPENILGTGSRYEVTAEGLQFIDDRVADSPKNYFRIICRKSTTLEPLRKPASAATSSFRLRNSQHANPLSSLESLTGFSSQRPQAVQANLDLRIEIQRSTFHQASVIISTNPRAAGTNRKWKISVKKIATTTGPLGLYLSPTKEFVAEGQRFDFPLQFQPGHRYRVTVAPLEGSDDGVHQNPDGSVSQTAEFRAELTLDEIKELYRRAVRHALRYGSSICRWLYRNKSEEYFQNIMLNRGWIMEVYDKDNSGDPASPINLQIKGLFFMASVERGTSNGEPLRASPFGPLRICVPAEELLAMAPNIYFVDFYCMRGLNHQVTLVMTRPGSANDRFCAERLLPLDLNDPANNPFFFYDPSGQLRVSTRDQLLVELLFTEDLDIRRYPTKRVMTVGKGSSTRGGIPKNGNCQLCSLQRYSAFQQF